MSDFNEGLYDQVVTRRVRQFLDAQAHLGVKSWTEVMEPNDFPDYLARHLIRQIKSVLRSLPSPRRRSAVNPTLP